MRTLQLLTLGLFAISALMTLFFQFRAGMKSGAAERRDPAADKLSDPDAARYAKLAARSAITTAGLLAVCIVLGALNR